ncbi:hypothetical protein KP509_19G026800 [Ceratopteris richardii]|uniref:WDR36/Utp21 C-terminal domain-containing protein n=1 Tax=Ceratopteris richardii TaxID=49495 RepID=A0A8T2SKS4_CERRI|nr:hypothetical protein KP509_19G026800 [Ceratopteris richardii]
MHIKVWNFKSGEVKSRWSVGSPFVKIQFHRGNARLVRTFRGHNDRVTDLCFSEDGKWILSSAMDGTIRIWDVVSAKQLDAMHVAEPVTSLSLSPTMDMLATTHVGHIGIYLWGNRLLYSGILDYGSVVSGEKVVEVLLPMVSSADEHSNNNEDEECIKESTVQEIQKNSETSLEGELLGMCPQIMPDMVTLSLLPKAQWQSLVNLDIIKMRNKPVDPPKKPEKAPFFLPSLPSLSGEPTFVKPNSLENDQLSKGKEGKKAVSRKKDDSIWDSTFVRLLHSCAEAKDFDNLLQFLKGLSPSEIDMEFQMLRMLDDSDVLDESSLKQLKEIGLILDFLIESVKAKRDFEFIQALTGLFLKVHGETILHVCRRKQRCYSIFYLQAGRG